MAEGIVKGRVFASVQFVLGFIIIFFSIDEYYQIGRTETLVVKIISICLLIACVLITVTAVLNFKQIITPNPVPRGKSALVTTGIYSVIRHPMYLGVITGLLGFSLYYSAYYTTLLNIPLIILFLFKIKFEERQLIEKFPDYLTYMKKTKKLIPFIY
jgi:protein-S-isoprenylcysteine O-methyltransferase Ste14